MKTFAAKVAIAVIALGALALVVAHQVFPGVAAWKVLAGAAAGAALLVIAACIHAALAGSLRQWLLRKGAIDVAWLWTPDYPEGFKRQRQRGADGESGKPPA